MSKTRNERRNKVRRLFASTAIALSIMVGVFVDRVTHAEDETEKDEDKPPDSESLALPTDALKDAVDASETSLVLTGVEAIQDAVIDAREREMDAMKERAEMVAERLRVIEEDRLRAEEEARLKALEEKRIAEQKAREVAELVRQERDREKRQVEAQKAEQGRKSHATTQEGTVSYEATHYTAFCPTGCTGVTASGHDVSSTTVIDGYRVLAAPKTVPFGTLMSVSYGDGTSFTGIVLDRGGDIGAGRLDVLVSNRDEAYRKGRQKVSVKVLRNGW